MSKFLLVLGVSAVGKSTIIEELLQLDSRFVYISPYMTRPLRDGEKNKISISLVKMKKMQKEGRFIIVNKFYNTYYATPKAQIFEALALGNFPVLDWPISRMAVMLKLFPSQLYTVYVLPPSISVLKKRLASDSRDLDMSRLCAAKKELRAHRLSQYSGMYDIEVIAEENKIKETSSLIYRQFLNSM